MRTVSIIENKKQCKVCHNWLDLSNYRKHSVYNDKTLLRPECRDCEKEKIKNYYLNNADKLDRQKQLKKEAYYKSKDQDLKQTELARQKQATLVSTRRKSTLKRFFNLSVEDYLKMLNDQNGVCAICKKSEIYYTKTGKLKDLAVDHCHVSGKVRGLLCSSCNNGLGCFKDNLELLDKAKEYLINSKL